MICTPGETRVRGGSAEGHGHARKHTDTYADAGLRPARAARCLTEYVPKPTKETWSPFCNAPVIAPIAESSARPAEALEMSAPSAIASIKSDLFTVFPFSWK